MIRASRITPFLLLSLTVLGLAPSLARAQAHTILPNVEHPLIYRPYSSSNPGVPPYVPSDIRTAYDFNPLYAHGINGTGTRIAIIDAYGDPRLSSDLFSFDSLTGLPATAVFTYYPDGTPTSRNSGWALETALDVEWAHSIAPAARIDMVVAFDSSLGSMYDGISYVANHLTNETVLSMSFGLSESQYPTSGNYTIPLTHQLFVTMTTHGTTPFASSGDNGASSCCDVSYPASDPLVIAVGGTTLNLGAGTGNYNSESAWSGSGAGSSIVYSKPIWQQGLGDPMRDITDVSYDGDPNTGVLVIQGGFQYQVGGTSAGSPQWAALIALASQATNTRFGSIASRLYNLNSYHDVLTGSDGYFTAGIGWDYPTGLGSPDASQLVSSLVLPATSVEDSTLIQGLNVTTTGTLQANVFSSKVSGPITVVATNITTGATVFDENFTILNISLQNQTGSQMARFILSIPATPYPLSSDISLTVQGMKTQATAMVTRRVDISGGPSVNINDVSTVMSDYDAAAGNPAYNPAADLAVQGAININDVSIAVVYYGAPIFS